jgi:hypothetical protein
MRENRFDLIQDRDRVDERHDPDSRDPDDARQVGLATLAIRTFRAMRRVMQLSAQSSDVETPQADRNEETRRR